MGAQDALSHQFDVAVSDHDALKQGVIAKKIYGSQHAHHRIVLSSEYSESDAHLIAAHMAGAHGMVTDIRLRI